MMAPLPPRRLVQVRLTEQAADGLDRYATRRNLTLTGLLEAMGRLLGDRDDVDPSEILELARQIDRQRRSRR